MVNSKALRFAALAALVFAGFGCKAIAGISDRSLVEQSDAGTGGSGGDTGDAGEDADQPDADADAPIDTSCNLPPPGTASLRLGNFIPSLDRVDFCIKPSDEPTFDGVLPTIASWGGGCQVGLGYRDLTAVFGTETGVFDIVAVRVDETTKPEAACAGTPIASASQVVVQEGMFLGLLLFGDAPSNAVLKGLPETRPSSNDSAIRFVHGLVGTANLDCSLTLSSELPVELSAKGFEDVPFASITPNIGPSDIGTIDDNGYTRFQLSGASATFGVAPTGTLDAFAIEANKYDRGVSYTIFALGRMNDNRFPPEVYICDEQKTDGILARCGGLAIDLRVDTLNAQLAGPYGPYDAERTTKMVETINGLETDALCLHEVWAKANRDMIIAGTTGQFPNSATFPADYDTVVDDPTDINGDTPPAFDQAPCVGDDAVLLDTIVDCLKANCFEPKNNETQGKPPAGVANCMTTQCLADIWPLISGTPEQKRCYACMFNGVASYATPATMREDCTTNPAARFVYGGDTATAVLSRFPIVNAESRVIASTDWRVNIIRAPLKLPNDAIVDLYCTQLTTPADGTARPYTGQYGNGKVGLAAWQEELYLQAQKLVNWVNEKSTSAGRMAVISGSFYSGPEYFDGQSQILESISVQAYDTLTAAFPFAAPPSYVPSCTFCSDNPILAPPGAEPSGSNSRQSHIFIAGIPITAVQSAEVVEYPLNVELVAADNTPFNAPISTHYGLRSRLRIVR